MTSPAIPFDLAPALYTKVFKEFASPIQAGLTKIMQEFFVGDPALIPVVVDTPRTLSFDEIFQGASVRLCWITTVLYMSVIDVIMVGTGKNKNHAAEVWRDLPEDVNNELEPYTKDFTFSGTHPVVV